MYEYAIALSGGISTGKSTVANLLSLQGFRKISADEISKKILEKNYQSIIDIFGSEYVQNNIIDKKKLANLIFNDKVAKHKLEDLLHPKIRDEIQKEATKLDEYKKPYLIEIPLFYETKAYDIKNVLVVYAPKDIQIDRLTKRDNLTLEEANARLNNQIDIEEKKNLATFVIDNTKDLKHLQSECEKFKIMILEKMV